jgi:chromate transporter
MIPLIEREVVTNKGWVEEDDFLDIIAVAQSAPGIIAINSALVIGYKVAGIPGAFMGALGAALPSFVIILLIARFFLVFRSLEAVEAFMAGAAPVVVALLVYASYSMGKKAVQDWKGLLLGLTAFVLALLFKLNPIILIVLGGLTGFIAYYPRKREGEKQD